MPPRIHLINSVTASERIIYKLLVEQPVLAFCCKGIELGPRGSIQLVVVSTRDGDVYIFDVKADTDIVLKGGLGRLIQSVDNVKVVHDGRRQAECLYSQFRVRLKAVFDVQEKYGDLMVKKGLPRRHLPLQQLVERYNIDRYTPSVKLQRLLREDMNVWSRRPLTKDMLNTAASDVTPLLPGLYVTLYRRLGYHERQNDEDLLDSTNEEEPEPPVIDPYSLPVSRISSEKPFVLPNNYLRIHLTK